MHSPLWKITVFDGRWFRGGHLFRQIWYASISFCGLIVSVLLLNPVWSIVKCIFLFGRCQWTTGAVRYSNTRVHRGHLCIHRRKRRTAQRHWSRQTIRSIPSLQDHRPQYRGRGKSFNRFFSKIKRKIHKSNAGHTECLWGDENSQGIFAIFGGVVAGGWTTVCAGLTEF